MEGLQTGEVRSLVMEGLQGGRIVNYVMKNGEVRPLVVVRVWQSGMHPGYLNGVLLIDGLNDEGQLPSLTIERENLVPPAIWITSTWYDENKVPGTWHWPDRPKQQGPSLAETVKQLADRVVQLERRLAHHGIVGRAEL